MQDRWSALPAHVRDRVLAALLFLGWFGVYHYGRSNEWHPRDPMTFVVAGVAASLALLATRRRPGLCLAAVLLVYPVAYATQSAVVRSEFHLLPVLLVGYVAASTGAVGLGRVLGACLGSIALLYDAAPGSTPTDASGAAFAAAATVAVVLLGAASLRLQRSAGLLQERNDELVELRALEARQVVAAERVRIARELHDVVAHHMGAVVIRAQAADRVADLDPGAPREAVQWIAATGQEALASMRQVVRVLRTGEGPAQRAPEESMAALPVICERMRAAGLAVDLELRGSDDSLGDTIELAVVRIVQEALTNTLVHASASRAQVLVTVGDEGCYVQVDDDGTAGMPDELPASGGHGLLGMRERAASCSGRLWLEHSDLGGWRVCAALSRAAA